MHSLWFLYNNEQILKMGQQSSGVDRIQQLSKSLTLIRSAPGEKILIDRRTGQEYLLLSRLAQGDDQLEASLPQRAALNGSFLPQLVEFGRENQGYCSDTAVLHMLFRQPARSLREEQLHRSVAGQGFQEGELLMVAYCTLLALQDYASSLGQGYEVTVGQDTLLIQIDGKIILTDAPRYKQQHNRHSLRRICSEQGRGAGRIGMGQLGGVINRMIQEDTTNQAYSENLKHFVELLKGSGFSCCEDALTHLEFIKKLQRSSSTKPKSYASFNETPTNIVIPSARSTPIAELLPLLDQRHNRQPLRELNNQNILPNANQGIKSFCYKGKRKESKLQIYKSKFEARKTEAFAEQSVEQIVQQESTIRLDEISSIQQRATFKEAEEDEESGEANENILPQGLICYESQQVPHQPPTPPLALFNSNRPERLKQLVLNQKGIIYEESADEISSMASQRTHRVRNFSFND